MQFGFICIAVMKFIHTSLSDLNTKTWQLYDKFLLKPVMILVSFSFSVNDPYDYYRSPTKLQEGNDFSRVCL